MLQDSIYNVNIDRTTVDIVSNLRPDLIIMNNTTKKTHILDVKVPYDDYSPFIANMVNNSKKYKDLQIQLSTHKRHSVTLGIINFGCLGAWDPKNELEFKQRGISKSESKIVSQIFVRQVVKQSYTIYLEHVKAVPKFYE